MQDPPLSTQRNLIENQCQRKVLNDDDFQGYHQDSKQELYFSQSITPYYSNTPTKKKNKLVQDTFTQLQQLQQNQSQNNLDQKLPQQQLIQSQLAKEILVQANKHAEYQKQFIQQKQQQQQEEKEKQQLLLQSKQNRSTLKIPNSVNNSQNKVIQIVEKNEKYNKNSQTQDKIFKEFRKKMAEKTFIQILKYRVPFKSITQLTQESIHLINDLSFTNVNDCYVKKYSIRKSRSEQTPEIDILQKIITISHQINVLDMDSFFIKLWEIILILSIGLNLFYIPIDMVQNGRSFNVRYVTLWKLFMFGTLFTFLFDMLLQFNTAILIQGQIIKKRRMIAKQYLSGRFIIDLLGIIPIIMQLTLHNYTNFNVKQSHREVPEDDQSYHKYFYLLIFCKTYNILKIFQQTMDRYVTEKKIYITLQFVQLILISVIIAHTFGCLFYGLNIVELTHYDQDNNWMISNDLVGADWSKIYLYAIYFSTTTMTTVGYGDMLPISNSEIIFTIFTMIISSGVFAYVLTSIGEIILEINRENKEYKTEMHLINRYLQSKHIGQNLKNEVRSYISFQIKLQNNLSIEEEQYVIGKLSDKLKNKINTTSNMKILKKSKLFSKFCLETQLNMAKEFKELQLQENELIFQEQDFEENPQVYFINQGQIEIFVESDNGQFDTTQIKILKEGNCFGEFSFFTGISRQSSARAKTSCTLYSISQKDFLDFIQYQQEDYELYHTIKNILIFRNKYQYKKYYTHDYFDFKCSLCGNCNHYVHDCAFLHYVPDKEKIILANNFSQDQKRSKLPNNIIKSTIRQKKWDTLIHKQKVKLIVKEFKQNLKEEEELKKEQEKKSEILKRKYSKRYINRPSSINLDEEIQENSESSSRISNKINSSSSSCSSETCFGAENDSDSNEYIDNNIVNSNREIQSIQNSQMLQSNHQNHHQNNQQQQQQFKRGSTLNQNSKKNIIYKPQTLSLLDQSYNQNHKFNKNANSTGIVNSIVRNSLSNNLNNQFQISIQQASNKIPCSPRTNSKKQNTNFTNNSNNLYTNSSNNIINTSNHKQNTIAIHPQQHIHFLNDDVIQNQNQLITQQGFRRGNAKRDVLQNMQQRYTTLVEEVIKYDQFSQQYFLEEKPYYAIKYQVEYNYNLKKIVQESKKYYQPFHKSFGIYTYINRFKYNSQYLLQQLKDIQKNFIQSQHCDQSELTIKNQQDINIQQQQQIKKVEQYEKLHWSESILSKNVQIRKTNLNIKLNEIKSTNSKKPSLDQNTISNQHRAKNTTIGGYEHMQKRFSKDSQFTKNGTGLTNTNTNVSQKQ